MDILRVLYTLSHFDGSTCPFWVLCIVIVRTVPQILRTIPDILRTVPDIIRELVQFLIALRERRGTL